MTIDAKTPADRLAEALTRLIDAADDAVGWERIDPATNAPIGPPIAQYDDGEWPAALKDAIKHATDVLSAYDARERPFIGRDLYSELADALGCDPMDSHEGRKALARKMRVLYDARKKPTVEDVAIVIADCLKPWWAEYEWEACEYAARAAMRVMGEER